MFIFSLHFIAFLLTLIAISSLVHASHNIMFPFILRVGAVNCRVSLGNCLILFEPDNHHFLCVYICHLLASFFDYKGGGCHCVG